MNYQIIATEHYLKKLEKFLKQHSEISLQYKKSIVILSTNPRHPSLRNHKLQGQLKQYYSVSINTKYRIVVDFMIKDNTIILIDIGMHNEVY